MILFLFNNFILFIKLFLFILIKLIFMKQTYTINILLILLSAIIFILYKYPRNRFKKLSKLRKYRLNLIKKYRISGFWNEIYNVILILTYFFGITGLLFYCRLLNKNKMVDLQYYYFLINNFVVKNSFTDIFCISLVYGLILVLYITLTIRIIKYFKFHIIKRHLYFMNFETNFWYQSKFILGFLYKIILIGPFSIEARIYKSIELVCRFIYYLFGIKKNYGLDYENLSYKEKTEICLKTPVDPDCLLIKYRFIVKITPFILKYVHYFILLIFIIYDLFYNNFILTKIFYILPWIFFYDLYVRASVFIDNLHLPYDQSFHDFIYATQIEVIDKNNIIIDGNIRDYNHFKHLYHTYVKRNFIKDRNDLFN